MSTAQDDYIKEEDNGSQTIRKFKHGEVIDLGDDDDYGDEKIEEKKEDTGNYNQELMEIKSEDQSNGQAQLRANPIFLSQDDLKKLALQHLGNLDVFDGKDFEIESQQIKMDKKGGSNSKGYQKRQKEMDSEDEEEDRQMRKIIGNLRNQVVKSFKTQTKEQMLFTIGFELQRPSGSQVSLPNRLLYFPMIFLNNALHLYIECFYLTHQQNQSKLHCKVNLLPCNEEMREAVIELFIQCVAEIQDEGLELKFLKPSNLSAGTWTRVSWDLKAQRELINMGPAPTESQSKQQKENIPSQKKVSEKRSVSEVITEQVRKSLKDQEKNYSKRTLSVSWVNSAVNKKSINKFVHAMLTEDLPILATCSSRSGNNLAFNRVDILPSDDPDTRDRILEVLFGELVCSVIDDENFQLKEVMDLPQSEGRNNWRYVSI